MYKNYILPLFYAMLSATNIKLPRKETIFNKGYYITRKLRIKSNNSSQLNVLKFSYLLISVSLVYYFTFHDLYMRRIIGLLRPNFRQEHVLNAQIYRSHYYITLSFQLFSYLRSEQKLMFGSFGGGIRDNLLFLMRVIWRKGDY